MGKTRCSICNHQNRNEIERHLVTGDLSLRTIGGLYGVTHSPLFRHKQNCMNKELFDILAPEIPVLKEIDCRKQVFMTGEEILGKFHFLIEEAEKVMTDAKGGEKKNPSHILMAIDRVNKLLKTYVGFMDIAKGHDGEKELNDWREIGAAIWEFVDKKGLRDEFDAELILRGLY
jgi:hypothetical protein